MSWQIGPEVRILTDFGCTLAVLLALRLMERGQPADTEGWRGYGMGRRDSVLKKVYALNAERLLARRR